MATILVKRDFKLTDPELAMFASKSRAKTLYYCPLIRKRDSCIHSKTRCAGMTRENNLPTQSMGRSGISNSKHRKNLLYFINYAAADHVVAFVYYD